MTFASEERLERPASPVRGARSTQPAFGPGVTAGRPASPQMTATLAHAQWLQGRIGNQGASSALTGAMGRSVTYGANRTVLVEERVSEIAGNETERAVLREWMHSHIPHHFADEAKLAAALQRAAGWHSERPQPPALFRRANLLFLTKAEGREPTLYFAQGNQSGRIRQQHPYGAGSFHEENDVHYFFAQAADAQRFRRRAKSARTQTANARAFLEQADHGIPFTTTPRAGAHHAEVSYSPDGKAIKKIHLSGGSIVTDLQGYDDAVIAEIYRKAVGLGRHQMPIESLEADAEPAG
jgi:hypothetical protein